MRRTTPTTLAARRELATGTTRPASSGSSVRRCDARVESGSGQVASRRGEFMAQSFGRQGDCSSRLRKCRALSPSQEGRAKDREGRRRCLVQVTVTASQLTLSVEQRCETRGKRNAGGIDMAAGNDGLRKARDRVQPRGKITADSDSRFA